MSRYSRLTLLTLMVLPVSVSAQHPRDQRESYPYGYGYSPWLPTQWSVIEYRTKCEGEQIRGTETGPIKWSVEFRNRSADLVTFDYAILPPGERKHVAASGRGKAKPGKIMNKLAVVPTSRCDEGVVIQLDKVRSGADADSVPYLKPDRAP